ncbi:MAG: hypothetical protein RW306_16380 [Geobacteraceae bacterium]|nr:hypothetical protein [Geobacteraceae bacterium]
MKKEFYIIKNRPKLDIRLTRDSVCAGDDVDAPHEKTLSSHSFLDPVALASHLSSGYLPSVQGVDHTWECKLNGNTIAIISTSKIEPNV